MFNPNLSQELALAKQRVTLLEQQAKLEQTTFGNQNVPNQQSLEQMVQQYVYQALAPHLPKQPEAPVQPTPQSTPQAAQPQTPEQVLHQTIADIAEQILTQEQLQWLAQKPIFEGIMVFLKSGKGQQAIGLLVDEYKAFLS